MKPVQILIGALAVCSMASPALAMRVINLDTVQHQLVFEAAGTTTPITLAPGEMHNFATTPSGRLSLLSAPMPKGGTAIQTQGILRDVIGNGRNQDIPADEENEYAIWPGGDLVLQQRIRRNQGR
ncbi:MAG: hypothetical protein ACKVOE_02815 [Rickettsiales bacterium]